MRFTIFGGLFALLLAVAGCGASSPKNEVVGEWAATNTKHSDKGELTVKADGSFVLCGETSGCLTGKYELGEREHFTTLDLKEDGAYTLCSQPASCFFGKDKKWLTSHKPGKTTLTTHRDILFSFPMGNAERGTLSRSTGFGCTAEQRSAGGCSWISVPGFWRGSIFVKKG